MSGATVTVLIPSRRKARRISIALGSFGDVLDRDDAALLESDRSHRPRARMLERLAVVVGQIELDLRPVRACRRARENGRAVGLE